MQAALGRFNKFHEFADVRRTVQLRANLFDGLRGVEFGPEQQPKGALDGFQTRAVESAALEADGVHAIAFRFAFGHYPRKRGHILGDDGTGADVRIAAHTAKLVHRTERSDIYVIFHYDVAGKRRAICKDGVAAHGAIVRHMGISHEKVVVSDSCRAAATRRAAANGGKFAEAVGVADDQLGELAAEFQILGISAHRTKGIENILASDARGPAYDRMRFEHALIAQLNLFADNGERADPDISSETGAC